MPIARVLASIPRLAHTRQGPGYLIYYPGNPGDGNSSSPKSRPQGGFSYTNLQETFAKISRYLTHIYHTMFSNYNFDARNSGPAAEGAGESSQSSVDLTPISNEPQKKHDTLPGERGKLPSRPGNVASCHPRGFQGEVSGTQVLASTRVFSPNLGG